MGERDRLREPEDEEREHDDDAHDHRDGNGDDADEEERRRRGSPARDLLLLVASTAREHRVVPFQAGAVPGLAPAKRRRPSAEQRREPLAPVTISDRAAERVLEHGSRRRPLLPGDEADTCDEEMLEELRVDPGYLERPFEGPDRTLGVCSRPLAANRLEERHGVEVVPLHAPQSIRVALDRAPRFSHVSCG